METCVGCGAKSTRHAYVGVGRENLEAGSGNMIAHPVCALCWEHPELRRRPLKVVFFTRQTADTGVEMARLVDSLSKSGADITIGGR